MRKVSSSVLKNVFAAVERRTSDGGGEKSNGFIHGGAHFRQEERVRSYSMPYRFLASFLCLCMIISVFSGLNGLFSFSPSAEEGISATSITDKVNMDTLTWKEGNSARNYMYWKRSGAFGGIQQKNYIHVFAFEGETITFGSNIYNSGLNLAGTGFKTIDNTKYNNKSGAVTPYEEYADEDSIDIVLVDLHGNRIAYDVTKDGKGHIPNVETEVLAKTMTSPRGASKSLNGKDFKYEPLTYTVQETGVYTIEFHSYSGNEAYTQSQKNYNVSTQREAWADGTGTTVTTPNCETYGFPSYIITNAESTDTSTGTKYRTFTVNGGVIAAWDVSVFSETGEKKTGRTYADYLAMQEDGRYPLKEDYYILTTDSYIYQMSFNGASPYTYNFFANNRGLLDSASGNILYKSVKEAANTFNFQNFGVSYKYPGSKDTELSKSFYIFFEEPSAELKGHMYEDALQPDPAQNIRFVDRITNEASEEVPGSYVGMGGYFSFEVREATTATLLLEFKTKDDDGIKYAPVEISDVVTPYSTNYFYWDGRDGNGTVLPKGTYSIEDIVYTVTTKAGEIHFPIFDMEYASGGISFHRINNVYNRDGVALDANNPGGPDNSNSIYAMTRNTIYYDDSNIYYGEKVASTGRSESDVHDGKINKAQDRSNRDYTIFRNINDGGEKTAYESAYAKGIDGLRVGDHSHRTHKIEYYKDDVMVTQATTTQTEMIDWLDSVKHPVALAAGDACGNVNGKEAITDHAISDFWTFIPAEPVSATGEFLQDVELLDPKSDVFRLTGRVFYDEKSSNGNTNGKYDPQTDGDHLIDGVELKLYKQTDDTVAEDGKTYVYVDGEGASRKVVTTANPSLGGKTVYELVSEGTTPVTGSFNFTNLEYNKTDGTEYLYQVIRPNDSYTVTSNNVKGEANTIKEVTGVTYGHYSLYGFDPKATGTEVQIIKVGGADGVDPLLKPSAESPNRTVTAIDVGYNYEPTTTLAIKKDWELKKEEAEHPQTTVFEISYTVNGMSYVYAEKPLSQILSWKDSFNYLPTKMKPAGGTDTLTVSDYYVSAEYYIHEDKIFRHSFEYDLAHLAYGSFVGKDSYFSLSEYYKKYYEDYKAEHSSYPDLLAGLDTSTEPINFAGYKYAIDNIPDLDGNGVSSADDLKLIGSSETYKWTDALPAGSASAGDRVVAPFNAVLDRNIGSAENTITITNASEPGTVEIFKYTESGGTKTELLGATFRIYEGEMAGVVETINKYNSALAELNESPEDSAKQDAFKKAEEAVNAIYVGSATTRKNGHIAFPGLKPNETYTVREVFPPAGYRFTQEYYEVHAKGTEKPKDTEDWNVFNDANYCLIEVGNAESSGEMAVRKRISGRAWNTLDEFTFDIGFGDNAVTVSDTEKNIFTDETQRQQKIKEFTDSFNDANDITIGFNSDFIDVVTSVVGDKDKVTKSADTKQSEPLIANAEEGATTNAVLNKTTKSGDGSYTATPVEFPLAGTYVFTIKENEIKNDATMKKSSRVFTMTVNVVRVLNDGGDSNATEANSHLEASVSKIEYQDPVDESSGDVLGGLRVFAGAAPTFVNEYVIQPAVQKTSYGILKNFEGRLSNDPDTNTVSPVTDWKSSDEFKFVITGNDEKTQQAFQNGDIYIEGLHGSPDGEGHYPTSKELTMDSTGAHAHGETLNGVEDGKHIFTFNAIDFNNVTFPVQWVKNPGEAGEQILDPDVDEIDPKDPTIQARTEPIEYSLKISEDSEHKKIPGVVYTTDTYTMNITLRNTVASEKFDIEDPSDLPDSVTDGIIDEMDFALYKNYDDSDGAVNDTVATCETDQVVCKDFETWRTYGYDEAHPNADGWNLALNYVDKDSKVHTVTVAGNKVMEGEVEVTETTVKDATLVAKYERHTGEHIMTFGNEFVASGTWAPTIEKTLNGRDWRPDEKFYFDITCTEWPDSSKGTTTYKPNIPDELEISSSSSGATEGTKLTGSFDTINFSAPGKYVFNITEIKGASYDAIHYEGDIAVTVNAAYGEGEKENELQLTFSADGMSEFNASTPISFVNTFDEYGDFSIDIAKTLTGRAWTADDSFEFTITPDGETTQNAVASGLIEMPEGAADDGSYTVTVSGTESGQTVQKSLGTLHFNNHKTKPAEYTFLITEKTDGLADKNIVCKQPQIRLTVNVSSKPATDSLGYTGELQFTATYAYVSGTGSGSTEDGSIVIPFENKAYAAGSFEVSKIFNEKEWESENFTANVTLAQGNTDDVEYENAPFPVGGKELTFTNSSTSHTLDFKFYKAGTYVFNVVENNGGNSKINYDPNTYTVTFTVTETPGALTASDPVYKKADANVESIEIVNTYIPDPVTAEISGTKVFTDGTLEGDDFSFTISAVTADAPMPDNTTVKNEETGNFTFGDITFTKAGTYTYTVKETAVTDDYIVYDKSSYTVDVTVTNNMHGSLESSVSYKKQSATQDSIEFTNVNTGSLKITKTVDGKYADTSKGFTFTVELSASGRYAYSGDQNGTIASGESVTLASGQSVTIKNLPDGTTYTVTETLADGYTANPPSSTGSITAGSTAEAAFTNTYSLTSASWTPKVSKTLNGREWKTGETFSFTLDGTNDESRALLTGQTAQTVTVGEHSGDVEFSAITFSEPGNYSFTVTENNPAGGITTIPGAGTPEGHTYTVAVSAVNDQNGNLVLTFTGGDGAPGNFTSDSVISFVNTYTDRGSLPIELEKKLVGRHWADSDVFLFKIKPDDAAKAAIARQDSEAGAKLRVPASWGTADENGAYTLEVSGKGVEEAQTTVIKDLGSIEIKDTEAKVQAYVFKLEEQTEGLVHMEGKESSVTLTVNTAPKLDGGNLPTGELEITATYVYAKEPGETHSGDPEKTTVPFENDAYITSKFTVSKSFEGKSWDDEEFSFTAKLTTGNAGSLKCNGAPLTGNLLNFSLTKDNNAKDMNLGFYAPGEYIFEINENAGGQKGVTYDGSVYTVTFNVTDTDGDLSVSAPVITKGGESAEQVQFVNTYKPDPGKAVLSGRKVFTDGTLAGGDFSFELSAVTENAPMPANTTATNDAAGGFAFDEITFNDVGTYTYTIKEVKRADEYIVFENTVYTAVVSATDPDKDGTMHIEVSYYEGENNTDELSKVDEAVFTNTNTGSLKITKTVDGQYADTSKGFAFTVELGAEGRYAYSGDQDGTIASGESVTLANGQSVTIKNLPDGTTYTVTETPADGYTANPASSTGSITAGSTAEAAFKNTYSLAPASWTPKVSKTLNGREWKTGETFSFTLDGVDDASRALLAGQTAQTVTVGEDSGDVSFQEIAFSEPGNYSFTVTENNPVGGITTIPGAGTPEGHTYTVAVSAVNDQNGNLVLTFTGGDGAPGNFTSDSVISFVNTYTDRGSLPIELEKKLVGRHWADSDVFLFKIKPDDAAKAAIARQDGEAGAKLRVPASWGTADENGAYTLEVSGKGVEEAQTTVIKDLGSIEIKDTEAEVQTYVFKLEEQTSGFTHMEGKESSVTLTVNTAPKLDGGNLPTGELEITATYVYAKEPGETHSGAPEKTTIPFENDAYITSKFTVGKSFEGKSWNDEEFSFTAKLTTGNAGSLKCNGAPLTGNLLNFSLTKDNNAKDMNLGFYAPGEYIFEINENAGGQKGVTYDGSVYTVTFNVTDTDGDLSVSAPVITKGGESAEQVQFVNTYKPDPGKAVLSGKKVFTNGTLAGGDFSFELSAVTENAPMPANTTVANDESGAFTFDAIPFTEAGTYIYEISEVNDGKEGVIYDDTVYIAEVILTDTEALLTESVNYYVKTDENGGREKVTGDVVFTNRQIGDLSITKELASESGTELTESDINREFGFTLKLTDPESEDKTAPLSGPFGYTVKGTDANGATVTVKTGKLMPDTAEDNDLAENDLKAVAPGVWSFAIKGGQTMTVNGLLVGAGYAYTLSEETSKGFDSDGNPTEEESQSTVSGTVSAAGKTGADVVFVNTKKNPKPATVDLDITKTVNDESNGGYAAVNEGDFSFTVKPAEGNSASDPIKSLDGWDSEKGTLTVSNAAPDAANLKKAAAKIFDGTSFTEKGVYMYTVSEALGNIPGMSYSGSMYQVTVDVSEDYADGVYQGALKASVSVAVNGEPADDNEIIFVNTYNPDEISVPLLAQKVLNGGSLASRQFTFELTGINAEYTESQDIVTGSGTSEETQGDDETQETDTEPTEPSETESEETELPPMPVPPVVAPDPNSNKVEQVNNADGLIDFGSVTLTESGTYIYKMSEAAGDDSYTLYDSTVYTVEIVIVSQGNKLALKEINYDLEVGEDGIPVFVNEITSEPLTGGLTVTNTVKGNAGDKNKEFHFRVELNDKTVNGTYGSANSQRSTETYADMQFQNGVAEFTLKHGQGASAEGLPVGVTYNVTETEFNKEGYTSTVNADSGRIPANSIALVEFVNEKNTEPPTEPPTEPQTDDPTEPPTEPQTDDPTEPPTTPPTDDPTEPPTTPPTDDPTEPPTTPPTDEPTGDPTEPPTEPQTDEPSGDPTEPPTEPLTDKITDNPSEPSTGTPTQSDKPTDRPNANVPRTGENSPVELWIMLMLLSASGAAILKISLVRRKNVSSKNKRIK